MKGKLLFIFIGVFLLGVIAHLNAAELVPVELTIVQGPNDGPAQDGKEPVTPNQFAVTLSGRVLNVTTKLNGVVHVELVNQTLQDYAYSGQFVKSVACELHSAGYYALSLEYNGTKLSGNFKLTLTQDEAAEIVLKKYEKMEDVEIYVSNKIFAPKDTIHIASEKLKGDYLIAPYETWVAYINLMPSANWSHACQYVLIDALTGKAIVEDRDMFPIDQSEYMPYRTRDWMQNVKVKTQQDAFLIADSLYKKETVSIWVSNTYYMGNESIELPTGDKIKVPLPLSMYWVVFVDLYPMANWGHPCDYLFIDAYSKRITKVTKDIFPLNQASLFTQLRWDNKNKQCLSTDIWFEEVSFVLGSNNVASRNFVILGNSNLSQAELPAAIVGIATPNMEDGHYSVYCDVLTAPVETGSLFITLSPDMYSNWSMTGTGYVDVDQSGRLEIIANHAELTDFMIGGNDFYPIKVEIDTTSILTGELAFDIYLVDSNDSIVGGERFVYRRGLSNSIPDPNMIQSDLSATNPILVDSMISCSPNPAHTYINVQVVDKESEIAICDIQGRCLIRSANTRVDVSSLSKGLYWIIVKTNNGYRQTKFIKQ